MLANPGLEGLPRSTHPEGAWQSPGYRAARTRARWTVGAFALSAVSSVFTLVVIASGYSLVSTYLQGDVVNSADYTQFQSNATLTAGFFALMVIVTGLAFLAWISRTVENVPPLGGGTPHYSPRWSIGWWFVPIAFLWKPYTVVREVADRLALPGRTASGVILVWWLLFVGGFITNRVSGTMASGPDATVEQFREALMVNGAGMACLTVAAIVGALMVREIQGRANERARSLELDAPVGAWPAAARIAALGAAAVRAPAPSLEAAFPTGQEDDNAPVDATAAATPGTSIEAAAGYCPSCGRARSEDSRFCAGCGRDLSAI